jgi:hypothetical protein
MEGLMRRLVSLSLFLALCATAAFAQPQPAKITWLRFYQVPPGKDADFLRMVNESDKTLFDKLIANGKVVTWGVAVPMTHTGESWTHVIYVGLTDWSATEAMVQAIESSDADAKRSAADVKRLDDLAMSSTQPGSVRDVILHHITQSEAPPMARPKYIGVEYYVVRQGRAGDATALFNEWAKPGFTDLATKGKFGPWGFSWQDNSGDYTHMVWYFMSDLAALDQRDTSMMAMDPMKLRGFEVRLRDLSEPEKHHTQLLRIVQQAP